MRNKKAQVTIFIIIAIILVSAVALFFITREKIGISEMPASIEPVYASFLACLEQDAAAGVDVLESGGGYISLPDFEPGSGYMPFSSQLNFLGNPIPYWYYVSGNNIQKEQVPSRKSMENQLEEFIDGRIRKCSFDVYYEQGFEIVQGEPEANVKIDDREVKVELDMDLSINKGNDTSLVKYHNIVLKSNLGKLYDSAKKIYEYEQESLFLEEYAVDILRLYAPVDGAELTCSPLVWNADEIFDDLQEAIEANTIALGVGGDKYFDLNLPVSEDVRFLNSKTWSNGFEVTPSEGPLLIANPVGNQPGLGILGFCYVPYHFVYNIRYPVLIQVYSGEEIFQFPIAVVLQNNNPREALEGSAIETAVPELCKYKNTKMQVKTYDMDMNPVQTEVSYACFGTKCNIGKTDSAGFLEGNFPQCVNGYIIARAEGFEDARYLYSTVESGSASVFLNKLYKTNIELKLDWETYNGDAMISFVSDDLSKTIVYPEQSSVELSAGEYEIQVYIYQDSEITLGETITEQCIEVPRSGIVGILGLKEEKCFDIEVPEQVVSSALAGGGKGNYYILGSELESTSSIEINAESLPSPETIDQLQDNHLLFESKILDITFK